MESFLSSTTFRFVFALGFDSVGVDSLKLTIFYAAARADFTAISSLSSSQSLISDFERFTIPNGSSSFH